MSQVRSETKLKFVPAEELSVPAWVYPYRVGVIGGALAGLAMVAVAMVYGALHGSIWLPANLIGATLIRDLQNASLEELSHFNLLALLAGLLLHFGLSIALGFVFVLLLPALPGPVLLWSVVIGSGLWVLTSLLTLPLLNPVMSVYVDRMSFFLAHVVYGFVLGVWIRRSPKIHVR